jgi:transcription elongation factor Elf1
MKVEGKCPECNKEELEREYLGTSHGNRAYQIVCINCGIALPYWW